MSNAKLLSLLLLVTWPMLPVESMAAELPRTGQRTCYDQEGNVIDHSGTGQDGDLQSGAVWPEPRFSDNGDGTVSDHLTGLMWLQDGDCLGTLSWQAAVNSVGTPNSLQKNAACDRLKAQYDDWFLPAIHQLETLFNSEESYADDWLNSRGFVNIQSGPYWSVTTAPNQYTAWFLRFDSGEVKNAAKVEQANVLLARYEKAIEETSLSESKTGAKETSPRFLDNGDGTVTDTTTNLMWLKDGRCMGKVDWQNALDTVQSFNDEPAFFRCRDLQPHYDDWALPNRLQLRSLIDPDFDLPALTAGHPFVGLKPLYWSSTSGAEQPGMAYDLFLGSGELQLRRKNEKRDIWPVRSIADVSERERITDRTQEPVYQKSHYMVRRQGERMTVSWPPKRFRDLGNGTLLDNVSGLMWLKDAQCIGRNRWGLSFGRIWILNRGPWKLKCAEYDEIYDDWQLPDLETLARLTETFTEEPASTLNLHGAMGVQARDYWSATENPMNLYYAWGMSLKDGTPRNYSKSFELYVWPVRKPTWSGSVTAEPVITGNDAVEELEIQQGDKLQLSVAVGSVTTPVAADFKIWYEDPEGNAWYLSNDGQWILEENILYRGNLFEMETYPVFFGSTADMALGTYIIHFDIQTLVAGGSIPSVFSSTLVLTLL